MILRFCVAGCASKKATIWLVLRLLKQGQRRHEPRGDIWASRQLPSSLDSDFHLRPLPPRVCSLLPASCLEADSMSNQVLPVVLFCSAMSHAFCFETFHLRRTGPTEKNRRGPGWEVLHQTFRPCHPQPLWLKLPLWFKPSQQRDQPVDQELYLVPTRFFFLMCEV